MKKKQCNSVYSNKTNRARGFNRAALFVLLTVMFAGCQKINYDPEVFESSQQMSDGTSEPLAEEPAPNIYAEEKFAYSTEIQAEQSGSKDKFVILQTGGRLNFTVNAPTTQHYKITVTLNCGISDDLLDDTASAVSETDEEDIKVPVVPAVAELTGDNRDEGDSGGGKISYGAFYAGSGQFEALSMTVYLPAGENKLTLGCLKGRIEIDKINVTNTDAALAERFRVSGILGDDKADDCILDLYEYLSREFGSTILTAQWTTPGTSAETDVIYRLTGKHPAVRVSDLMLYGTAYDNNTRSPWRKPPDAYFNAFLQRYDLTAARVSDKSEAAAIEDGKDSGSLFTWDKSDNGSETSKDSSGGKSPAYGENDDIPYAEAWAKRGGIVAYTWAWKSPSQSAVSASDAAQTPGVSAALAGKTDFKLSAVDFGTDVSMYDTSQIEEIIADGKSSPETLAAVRDIDRVAAQLLRLRDKNIPVLWEPLPQAGTGLYWWGTDAEQYKKLYRLMHDRFTNYYRLHNLIWVWSGEDADYFPGDKFTDIVGTAYMDAQEPAQKSRFDYTDKFGGRLKPAALTNITRVPNPDIFFRDKAMWSYAALAGGNYIIGPSGELNGTIGTDAELEYFYNSRLTTVMEELTLTETETEKTVATETAEP